MMLLIQMDVGQTGKLNVGRAAARGTAGWKQAGVEFPKYQ